MTSAPIDGVEHRQLKDSVYLKLRQEIVSGKLPPGYLLREAELAARFGVSKTPLREAFVRLEKDGFVEIAPYRSAVVGGYSRQDLREIYEVRELLEGLCAREAALNIATEDLADLSRLVGEREVVNGPREGARQFPKDFKTRKSPTANVAADLLRRGMEAGYLREDDPWEITFEMGALLQGLIMLFLGGRVDISRSRFRSYCHRSFRRYLNGIRK